MAWANQDPLLELGLELDTLGHMEGVHERTKCILSGNKTRGREWILVALNRVFSKYLCLIYREKTGAMEIE